MARGVGSRGRRTITKQGVAGDRRPRAHHLVFDSRHRDLDSKAAGHDDVELGGLAVVLAHDVTGVQRRVLHELRWKGATGEAENYTTNRLQPTMTRG